MANLDGKDVIKPTPFDAHEQIVRGPHTHSLERGYEKAELIPAAEVAEAAEVGEAAAPAAELEEAEAPADSE